MKPTPSVHKVHPALHMFTHVHLTTALGLLPVLRQTSLP